MRRWAAMLGALIVWMVHFMGVYALASAADVYATADDLAWRMAGLAFSALCLIAALVLTGLAARAVRRAQDPAEAFRHQLALLGGGVSAVAIAWQALPTVIGY